MRTWMAWKDLCWRERSLLACLRRSLDTSTLRTATSSSAGREVFDCTDVWKCIKCIFYVLCKLQCTGVYLGSFVLHLCLIKKKKSCASNIQEKWLHWLDTVPSK